MIQNLLGRKEKATRQERILSEIDRLISWKKLAACAEDCLDEAPDCAGVDRNSLERLVRMEVMHRCFGIPRSALAAAAASKDVHSDTADVGTTPLLPNKDEVDCFYKMLADCNKQDQIINELGAQLSKVGITLKQPVTLASS